MGIFDLFGILGTSEPSKPAASYEPSMHESPGQYRRMICDSFVILKKTTNPSIFFYRYQFAIDTARRIWNYNGVIYNGMTAQQIVRYLNGRHNKYTMQTALIDRLFAAHKENLLVYQMDEIGYKLTREAKKYYFMKLQGKKFHFVKVKFDVNSKKTYTYVAKNSNIKVGDTVTVKTGNANDKELHVVQVVEVFDGRVDRLPFEFESLKCVESTLRGIACPHCGAGIQIDVTKKTGQCAYCGAEFYLLS